MACPSNLLGGAAFIDSGTKIDFGFGSNLRGLDSARILWQFTTGVGVAEA